MKETEDLLKWDNEEEVYYLGKDEWISLIVSILNRIFMHTLNPNTSSFFNIDLLIRQNYLTICETPEILDEIFGNHNIEVSEYDEEGYSFHWLNHYEDEVINEVKSDQCLKDLDITNILKL